MAKPLSSLVLVALVVLVGCAAGPPPPPSTPAQRTASPTSITRDNPGGDAVSPVDAALTRLLEEPVRPRSDRFQTLLPHFADAPHWKRVRFWGYPTRAGFRYGKKAIAVGAVLYWEAENDRPSACLQSFVQDARKTARLFDVEVTDPEHALLEHRRGVEALDEETIGQAIADFHEERRRRARAWKKRREKLRQTYLRRRRAAITRRQRLLAARRARAEAAQKAPQRDAQREAQKDTVAPPADAATAKTSAKTAAGGPPASHVGPAGKARPRPAPRRRPRPSTEARGGEEHAEVVAPRAEGTTTTEAAKGRRPLPRANRKVGTSRRPRGGKPAKKLSPAERRARDAELAERRRLFLRANIIKKLTKELGSAPMPTMTAEGRFSTLLTSDHYVTAMVAYRSWPGTCLVQAFGAKVGTDPALARAVRDRWLADQAPALMWRPELTEAPPVKNR